MWVEEQVDLKTPCQTSKLEEEIDGLQNGDLFSLPLSFPSRYHSDCLILHLTGNPPNVGMGSGGVNPAGVSRKEVVLARECLSLLPGLMHAGGAGVGVSFHFSHLAGKNQVGTLSEVVQSAELNSSPGKMSSGPQVQDRARGKGSRQSQPQW